MLHAWHRPADKKTHSHARIRRTHARTHASTHARIHARPPTHAPTTRFRPAPQVTLPKIDLSKFTDSYFKPAESKKEKKGEKTFFDEAPAKAALPADYVANQKALDAALLPALNAEMKAYLASRFTLRDGDRPHLMKF
jgi:hypothetical protein